MWQVGGFVFWKIILLTTIVGITLSFIYAPRTWCSFCPMGSLSSWVAPKKAPLPKVYKSIHVSSLCEEKCKLCARVCPMQLTPYSSRGEQLGYLHPDCLKCRKCEKACPTKIIKYTKNQWRIIDDNLINGVLLRYEYWLGTSSLSTSKRPLYNCRKGYKVSIFLQNKDAGGGKSY